MVLDEIELIKNKHRLAASQSQYDRTVAITAISKSCQILECFQWTGDDKLDLCNLLTELNQFINNYHDSSGEFTSGKGVIGSFRDEIYQLKNRLDNVSI